MSRQNYKPKTTIEAFEEMHDAIERFGQEIGRVGAKSANDPKVMGILAKAGIDGKLTGADVLISLMALGFGLVAAAVFFMAKVADGYRVRDASGCAVDVMTIVIGVVLIRFVLDVLSVPLVLASLVEVKSLLPEAKPPVVRDTVFVNRQVRESNDHLVGLPNGETIGTKLLIQYLETVKMTGGKVWSREEWCNSPADSKRPGRGLMSQDEWAGVKLFLEELDLWRATKTGPIDDLIADLER
jgi:hypothetical protein